MNRRLHGSSSGAGPNDARDALPRISAPEGSLEEYAEFPSFSDGHASPEKKQVVDAGLKSLDHCMRPPAQSCRSPQAVRYAPRSASDRDTCWTIAVLSFLPSPC